MAKSSKSKISNSTTFEDWVALDYQKEPHSHLASHPGDVYLKLIISGGKIAEDVRRNRFYGAIEKVGDSFSSLFTVYNRVAHDAAFIEHFQPNKFSGIEKYMFNRFPRVCWLCGEKRCECYIKFADQEARTPEEMVRIKAEAMAKVEEARNTAIPPKNLGEWEILFKDIYGQGHRYMGYEHISLHLLEEIGELSEALDNLINEDHELSVEERRDKFCDEYCDVVSWLFALRHKSAYYIKQASKKPKDAASILSLADDLKSIYSRSEE